MRLHHVILAPTMPMGLEKLFSFKNLFLEKNECYTPRHIISFFEQRYARRYPLTAKFKGALL